MRTIIFATNNENKVREIQKICPQDLKIISLKEAGIEQEIPEPFDTLEENAQEKTRVIYELTGKDCFAEDTGLEIAALHGAPGVKSARYAGEHRNDRDNMALVLKNMKSASNRSAQFRTVISYCKAGAYHFFEGICKGTITLHPEGINGFGYDPIFKPEGFSETFGVLAQDIKYQISHRAKAFIDFSIYLPLI